MNKLELLQKLNDLESVKEASAADAVKADFAPILEAAQALDEESPDVVELQKQVADLQAQKDAALAEVAKDEALLSDELSKEAKLQAKLDAIKAALEG